jgi:hypothetical protein
MISHPRVGQAVRLKYRASRWRIAPHHDRVGLVVAVAQVTTKVTTEGKIRRTPLNHLIRIGDELVVVFAGQLNPVPTSAR